MTAIPLGSNAYARPEGHLPEIKLVNMLLEKDPTNLVDGITRLQRPGLTSFVNLGSLMRGIFREPGIFGGDFLAVCDTSLYRVTVAGAITELGSIPGFGLVEMCAGASTDTNDRALIATGDACYSTDGNTVVQVAMPDGIGVKTVCYLSGYYLLGITGSHHIFWLSPTDVNPDPLSYFSVESRPGNMVACRTLGDALFLSNDSCMVVWYASGVQTAPFTRQQGILFDKGNASRDATCELDNGIFWVGLDGIVYRTSQGAPQRLSNHGIEQRIRAAGLSGLVAWTFTLDGHSLYSLLIPGQGTFAFDIEGNCWSQFKSYGQTPWRVIQGAQAVGQVVVGMDGATGDLWTLDFEKSTDGGQPMERIISGNVPARGKPHRCDNIEILAPTGYSVGFTRAQVCWSDDGGATYDEWMDLSLGTQGEYGLSVIFRQLGMITGPGRVFQVRCTDDVVFRLSGMSMNESGLWAQ